MRYAISISCRCLEPARSITRFCAPFLRRNGDAGRFAGPRGSDELPRTREEAGCYGVHVPSLLRIDTLFKIIAGGRVVIRIVRGAGMQKKLTITLDERVYNGLHTVIGRRRISRFIESLVRPS